MGSDPHFCLWSYQERIDAGEYQSNQSDEVRAEFERDAWAYLIEYLMTLEAPDSCMNQDERCVAGSSLIHPWSARVDSCRLRRSRRPPALATARCLGREIKRLDRSHRAR